MQSQPSWTQCSQYLWSVLVYCYRCNNNHWTAWLRHTWCQCYTSLCILPGIGQLCNYMVLLRLSYQPFLSFPPVSLNQKCKRKFLYSTVSNPQNCSKHFTSLTDLFNQTPSQLLWEASSHIIQLMREGCSYTYPLLSIAGSCRVKKLAQSFNTAVQDSNPGPRSQES